MNEVSRTALADTAKGQNLLADVEPIELYAAYVDGGTLSVGRYQNRQLVAEAVGSQTGAHLVVSVDDDGVAETPVDCVWMHDDEQNTVELLDRAIVALTAAREACGRATGGC